MSSLFVFCAVVYAGQILHFCLPFATHIISAGQIINVIAVRLRFTCESGSDCGVKQPEAQRAKIKAASRRERVSGFIKVNAVTSAAGFIIRGRQRFNNCTPKAPSFVPPSFPPSVGTSWRQSRMSPAILIRITQQQLELWASMWRATPTGIDQCGASDFGSCLPPERAHSLQFPITEDL